MLCFKLEGADIKLANKAHTHQGSKYFTFSDLHLMNRKPDNYRRFSPISLKIESSTELLKIAYEAGLGEKNTMGFG